jgi:putative DNA primase/helicase
MDRTKLHLTRTRAWMRDKAAAIAEARPSMAKKAAELRDDRTIYAIDKLATSNAELVTTSDRWDRDPMLLGGPQTVDLRSGEAREPRPLDFILKRTACAPAPEETTAPLWSRFLGDVTNGDTALQAYMQRMAGYWLTGSVSEHCFFFFYGTGANGKSTFINTIRQIMKDYATTIGSEVLMWSKLRGIRLAVASEIERGKVWAESKIKSLTGGDEIQARFMRQDFFTFTPQFKLAVIGNYKPSLRAVDEAIRRRLHLIRFTVTIPPHRRDKSLEAKLQAEAPSILRWMLDGCLEWQRQGLAPPDIVKAATVDTSRAKIVSSGGATIAPSWIRASGSHPASCGTAGASGQPTRAKPWAHRSASATCWSSTASYSKSCTRAAATTVPSCTCQKWLKASDSLPFRPPGKERDACDACRFYPP